MGRAVRITLTRCQRSILESWVRSRASTPARLVERARIILLAADGMTNEGIGDELGVDRQRVRRWRTRWAEDMSRLRDAEQPGIQDKDLATMLRGLLADEPRPGAPSTFTAEQLAQIISVACERPEECGRPVTHWTPRELVDEVVKRGIVESISPRHVDRILKGGISDRTKRGTG